MSDVLSLHGLAGRNLLGLSLWPDTHYMHNLFGSALSNYTPADLFAAGEQGAWYDPSDMSTMFQDAAGTTPVTAVGQPVGLMLDKSKGLGPELVTNGDFSNGTTGWSLDAGWALDGGVIRRVTGQAPGGAVLSPVSGFIQAGKTYQVRWTRTGATSNGLKVRAYSAASGGGTLFYNPGYQDGLGAQSHIFTATQNGWVALWCFNDSNVITIDNISVRELPGNHATQPTSTSRPVLSARYNLLTKTEQFDDAVWSTSNGVTIVSNNAVDPLGGLTADTATFTGIAYRYQPYLTPVGASTFTFSIWVSSLTGKNTIGVRITNALGTDSQISLVTLTTTPTKITVTKAFSAAPISVVCGLDNRNSIVGGAETTGDVIVWGASLVPADQAALPYQRVNTATDYDADPAKFKPYLQFDGVDDFLVTNTITPGTDKVQVFAGVRRLANGGIPVELSAAVGANNGSFYVFAGDRSAAAGSIWTVSSRGNAVDSASQAVETAAVYNAPLSNVVAGLFDISGDSTRLRINGSQVASATGDQGTGNFLAYPLYIGRRGGTSLPFNGHLYSLITRFGSNLSNDQITQTENWVNSKTGAY